MAYEYSTNIEDFTWLSDLTPYGTQVADKVKYWLGTKAGWSEEFYHTNESVTKEDFGTSNTGYQGLDSADFHYHFGHGLSGIYNNTSLRLLPLESTGKAASGDVYKKWDSDNEWALLDCCYVLSDPSWGNALKYSHMILGFTTVEYPDTDLPEYFFYFAVDQDWTILDAYQMATIITFGDDVNAAVRADTEEQLYNDHLWGQGYVAGDEYPDDDITYFYEWNCM